MTAQTHQITPSDSAADSGSDQRLVRPWRGGDVARVDKIAFPRMLILELSDCAYCLDEHGHQCSWDVSSLLTLPEWIDEVRLLARENEMRDSDVDAYIASGSTDFSWPNTKLSDQ